MMSWKVYAALAVLMFFVHIQQIKSCDAGFLDCNLDPSDDCETEINVDNCGGCGVACLIANGVGQCNSGSCTILSCNEGYEDCNDDASDGCEANTGNDINHCGGCSACDTLTNTVVLCVSGECEYYCLNGKANCNDDIDDGCEADLLFDGYNCGDCETSCQGEDVCNGGVCGAPTECESGEVLCDSVCQDILEDGYNCGECGFFCGKSDNKGIVSCDGGDCFVTCEDGYADCDMETCNTCEVYIMGDVDNCGRCGNACPTGLNAIYECVGKICEIQSCEEGYSDCDGNDLNGCETKSDTIQNCGDCGIVCSFDNAVPFCSPCGCDIDSCLDGYFNCNEDDSDGCETDVSSDINHCGACMKPCPIDHICQAGVCVINCQDGFLDCNLNPSDGCEAEVGTDNCGGCGVACLIPNGVGQCNSGTCTIQSCNAGFEDCNNDISDGCEMNIGNDINHCGGCLTSCGTRSSAIATCVSGECEYVCFHGKANCNGDIDDGCEADLLFDGYNCGDCETSCQGEDVCNGGVCGAPTECESGEVLCDSVCQDILEDGYNCGECGFFCGKSDNKGIVSCDGGDCFVTCEDGYADCDMETCNTCEVYIMGDVDNCGRCGNACPTGLNAIYECVGKICEIQSCEEGYSDCDGNDLNGCETKSDTIQNCGDCGIVCSFDNAVPFCSPCGCDIDSCLDGYFNCNEDDSDGCETDVSSDINHCGECMKPCSSGHICQAGVCVEGPACGVGETECGGVCVNLNTDIGNCGACSKKCPDQNATPSCTLGSCSFVCNEGFDSCDGQDNNGCEQDLSDNINYCGTCDTVCSFTSATAICNNGACELDSCNEGTDNCDDNDSNGCETDITTTDNCGSCGNQCQASADNGDVICSIAGTCEVTCNEYFGNCDECDENGCETYLLDEISHCGTCGNDCEDGYVCTTDYCTEGYCESENLDCDDGDICTGDDCEEPNGCANEPTECTVTISLEAGPSTFEGDTIGAPIHQKFVVKLSHKIFDKVSFSVVTEHVQTDDEDFIAINTYYEFSPYTDSLEISVILHPDYDYELDETYTLKISDGYATEETTNVVIGVDSATGTILNDDKIIINDDAYLVQRGVTLTVNSNRGIFKNDHFNEVYKSSTFQLYKPPQHGTLNMYPNGAFSYVPPKGCTYDDYFVYSVTGTNAHSVYATVLLLFNPCLSNTGEAFWSMMYQPITFAWPNTPLLPTVETGFYLTFENNDTPHTSPNWQVPTGKLPATSITFAPSGINTNVEYDVVLHTIPNGYSWDVYPSKVKFVTGSVAKKSCAC